MCEPISYIVTYIFVIMCSDRAFFKLLPHYIGRKKSGLSVLSLLAIGCYNHTVAKGRQDFIQCQIEGFSYG